MKAIKRHTHHGRRQGVLLLILLTLSCIFVSPAFGDTCTWTNEGSGNNWSTGKNWRCTDNKQRPPSPEDDAVLSGDGGGNVDVALNVSATVANLNIGNGLILANNFNIGTTLTVRETMTWSGGLITGEGSLIVDGSTVFTGGPKSIFGFTLALGGGSIWDSGELTLGRGSTLANTIIRNPAGSTFEIATPGNERIGSLHGNPVFENQGTLIKSTDSATSIDVNLQNTGRVDVQAGKLTFHGGGLHDGASANLAEGTMLVFGLGQHTVSTSRFNGTGTVACAGGTTNLDSSVVSTALLIDAGTHSGPFNVNSAIAPSRYTHVSGTLGGIGDITVDGEMTWTGGRITGSGTISVRGFATLSGGQKNLSGRTLALGGGARWNAGLIQLDSNGTLRNLSGSTFEIESTGELNMRRFGGSTRFDNQGILLRPSGSTGSTDIDPFLNNGGTITLGAGTLAATRVTQTDVIQLLGGMLIMQGDYVQTGGFTLLDNGTLRMANTNHTLMIQGGVLGGSGTIEGNVALSNNASLIPGFRQLTTSSNHQLGVLTIVGGNDGEFSLGRDVVSDFEIGGRAQGIEYDAVVSGTPMTFSVGGTLGVLLVNGFESTITRNDRFVIFETALNPIRGSFFNVANGGRLAAMNTNGDDLGTFRVHYGSNSTDSPTMVVLKDFDTTIIIMPNPQNTPESRAFFPSRNDKSGVIEVAAIVRSAPSGATYHWTQTDADAMRIDSSESLQTLVRGLKPGKHELDFTVRDSSGGSLASQKLQLSIPQFVTIDEEVGGEFDAVLAAIHLTHVKNNVIEEAKWVCDHLLRTSNIRAIWRIGPFSEVLPAHLPVATHVTTLKIRGEPTTGDVGTCGQTFAVGGAAGETVFNELIEIYPGCLSHQIGNPTDVDTDTLALVSQLENQTFTDPALVSFATKVVGRLIGETMAHEIVHSLLWRTIPGPFGSVAHNPRGSVANDLMNHGDERSFTQRTGLEDRSRISPIDPDDFVDHGIAAIGGLQAVTQGLMDARFPVPPSFR